MRAHLPCQNRSKNDVLSGKGHCRVVCRAEKKRSERTGNINRQGQYEISAPDILVQIINRFLLAQKAQKH